MYHDTHVHLDILLDKLKLKDKSNFQIEFTDFSSQYQNQQKEQDQLIHNSIQKLLQGHDWLIQSTTSFQNFQAVWRDFGFLEQLYFLCGSHPEIVTPDFDLNNYLKGQEKVKSLLSQKKCLGIGECGLDYFYSQDSQVKNLQQILFESQIQLAIDFHLPLVIHCREAFADLIPILKNFDQIQENFLVHCFTGDREVLYSILDLGGKVAFGGILTFGKNADYLRDSARACPNQSFVLETDLPFLSPKPFRGQICLPEYIQQIALALAQIKETNPESIWQFSDENSKKLFTRISEKFSYSDNQN